MNLDCRRASSVIHSCFKGCGCWWQPDLFSPVDRADVNLPPSSHHAGPEKQSSLPEVGPEVCVWGGAAGWFNTVPPLLHWSQPCCLSGYSFFKDYPVQILFLSHIPWILMSHNSAYFKKKHLHFHPKDMSCILCPFHIGCSGTTFGCHINVRDVYGLFSRPLLNVKWTFMMGSVKDIQRPMDIRNRVKTT